MPPAIAQLLKAVRRPHPAAKAVDLQTVREALLKAIEDCPGLPTEQLRMRIRVSRHPRDLWQLRSEAFHVISLQHCQSVADDRIGALMHLFNGAKPQERQRAA